MTTYDKIIQDRIKGIPIPKAQKGIGKNNVLCTYAYETNDLISFNKDGDYAMFYGPNDCIYWIQTNFTNSSEKYILYILRSDGTLLVHPTDKMLNYSDKSTFTGLPFGIVCNIYQSATPKIPIDDLKDGCIFGLLFQSEYKTLTGSDPGHASGLTDPTNKDTFERLTGLSSPISMGGATFPNKGSSRYPLYSQIIDVTNGRSNDPFDYYGTRCNYAIEASRGKDGKGYSPLVGSMYNNMTIDMGLSYPYGYITYEEYKKSDQIIKGYDIRYKISYYRGGSQSDEYKITSDGELYINDVKNNLSPSTLYIPLHAQGLLWYNEWWSMIKLSSYDKIYEELTGVRRGGLNDPGKDLPRINPNDPIDVTPPTNTQPPDNTPPSDPGAPVDVNDNDNTYNNNDPEVGSPQQPPPSNTTEQNTNDTSGDIEQNTVANFTNALYQNATDPGSGNSTDTQLSINQILQDLGNTTTTIDGPDIAVVEFNKGKEEIILFTNFRHFEKMKPKFDKYFIEKDGKYTIREEAKEILFGQDNLEGEKILIETVINLIIFMPRELKSNKEKEKYIYDSLKILMGEENLKNLRIKYRLTRQGFLKSYIEDYANEKKITDTLYFGLRDVNVKAEEEQEKKISQMFEDTQKFANNKDTKEEVKNLLKNKIENASNNNERLKLKQTEFLVNQNQYTERQLNDIKNKLEGKPVSQVGVAIILVPIVILGVIVMVGMNEKKKMHKKNIESGEKLKIYD